MQEPSTILIVDDLKGVRALLGEILVEEGYDVALAGSGEEALARAVELIPDLILLDVMMPEMDGLEVCRRLKDDQATADIPVIFISAKDEPTDETRGFALGAVDYIAKPFTPPIVKARVRTHLALHNQNRMLEELVRARTANLQQSNEQLLQQIVEREQAEEALRQRNRELELLNRASRAFSLTLDLNQVLITILHEIRALLDAVACSVWMIDPETDELVCQNATGPRSAVVQGWRLAPGQGLAGWTARHRESLIVPDTTLDERHFAGVDERTGLSLRSVLTVPVHSKAGLIGVIQVADEVVDRFSSTDLTLLELVASGAASAIENARLYGQAHQEIEERKRVEEALAAERASLAQRVAEATAELSTANAELTRATRLKDEFLASMSHELRTPLNAILGMSEVLKMNVYGSLNDEQLNAVKHVEESGQHLLELITDILDLSKIEAGKLELEINTVFIEDVCQASLRFVKQMAQKKRLKTVSAVDPSATTMQADERRLKQILVNLLSNAVKFTPAGGEIGLEVEQDEADGVIHFTVWDTGIGISEEEAKELFKPFSQIDSSLARQHEGTGLGLAMVGRLAEMHGGSVTLASEVGQGSRFTVSLPWGMPDHTMQPADGRALKANNESVSAVTVDRPAAPVVLLAEDNEPNLITVQDFLQSSGYRVVVARDGAEAVNRAGEEHPDIILMDIQMPGTDGLEATRRLRTDPALARIPIIALTALAMPGDRERCLAAGVNDYLSKPVSLKRLVEVIEAQLQQARSS